MADGSVIQRFSPSLIWKIGKLVLAWLETQQKGSLVGAARGLQVKIKRLSRFSRLAFFPKIWTARARQSPQKTIYKVYIGGLDLKMTVRVNLYAVCLTKYCVRTGFKGMGRMLTRRCPSGLCHP